MLILRIEGVAVSKVKVAKLAIKHGNRRPKAVARTVVRRSNGRMMEVFTVDANSPTFDDDLTYVYRENVANARRENERLFGSADGFGKAARRFKSSGLSDGIQKK
jgi:hypothetical protein